MTLRRSEAVLRLLMGLALGFGFLGFAMRSASHATHAPSAETPLSQHAA